MAKFLIEKNGVYYLTTGRLLTYDPKATDDNPSDSNEIKEKKKAGVNEVAAKFKEIRDSPHTWYQAVEINQASFAPMNTGDVR